MVGLVGLVEAVSDVRTQTVITWAFVKKNFRDWASNRTSITLETLWIIFYAAAWGIFATVALKDPEYVAKVQLTARNAVDFILIGRVTSIFFWSTRGNLTWLIRGKSFANLWTAPVSFLTIVIGGNAWRYTWLLLEASLWVVMGVLIFDMTLKISISIIFVLVGGFLVMQSLELIAAGTTIVTKAGRDPVNWFLDITSMLVTGMMFPVQFLPGWLKWISDVHPQRYLLDLSRKSLSLGMPLRDLWSDIIMLFITGIILLAVGMLTFRWGFNKARREGTIGHR